jgi:hypothetical protein
MHVHTAEWELQALAALGLDARVTASVAADDAALRVAAVGRRRRDVDVAAACGEVLTLIATCVFGGLGPTDAANVRAGVWQRAVAHARRRALDGPGNGGSDNGDGGSASTVRTPVHAFTPTPSTVAVAVPLLQSAASSARTVGAAQLERLEATALPCVRVVPDGRRRDATDGSDRVVACVSELSACLRALRQPRHVLLDVCSMWRWSGYATAAMRASLNAVAASLVGAPRVRSVAIIADETATLEWCHRAMPGAHRLLRVSSGTIPPGNTREELVRVVAVGFAVTVESPRQVLLHNHVLRLRFRRSGLVSSRQAATALWCLFITSFPRPRPYSWRCSRALLRCCQSRTRQRWRARALRLPVTVRHRVR